MNRRERVSTSGGSTVPFTCHNSDTESILSDDNGETSNPISSVSVTPEGQAQHAKNVDILEYMRDKRVSLGDLLVAVCYGNPLSREDGLMQSARASIYQSENLRGFLNNSYEPPRAASQGGPRPAGGTATIRSFVLNTANSIFRDELSKFTKGYTITPEQMADQDYLATITSESLHQQAKSNCPHLYDTLRSLTSSKFGEDDHGSQSSPDMEDEEDGDGGPHSGVPFKKHPEFGVTMQIAALAYRLNPKRNKLQKIIGVYLKAKHTSKAAFYILSQAGITMSYNTIRKLISDLSGDIHQQMMLAAKTWVIIIFHDNICLKYGVSLQHGDNQAVSDNGTAISMLVLPDDVLSCILEDPDDWGPFMCNLIAQRQAGTAPKLAWVHLNSMERLKRNCLATIFDILDFIKTIPGFSESEVWKLDKLKRPIGPQQLPYGLDYWMLQYMLATINIDESSYSGNSQIIPYVLKQLGLDSIEELVCLALQWRIIWMTLGAAVLETFRGTTVGASLGGNIVLLSHTGLEKKKGKKRHDYHDVDELLLHEMEAHIQGIFGVLTGCKNPEEAVAWLQDHNANDVYKLAEDIYKHHTSLAAAERLKTDDELCPTIIRCTWDLLMYYGLQRAFCNGDMDRFEDLLPDLLCYFLGSGHSLYAKEVMEFLQLIWHESTPKLKSAIMRHGIKELGPPPHNASWEQYAKISQVIPFLQNIVAHVEGYITGLKHSHIHKNPKHKLDVQALIESHRKQEIHYIVPHCKIHRDNKAKDVMDSGIQALCEGNILKEFHKNREVYFSRISTEQEFEDIDTPPLPNLTDQMMHVDPDIVEQI